MKVELKLSWKKATNVQSKALFKGVPKVEHREWYSQFGQDRWVAHVGGAVQVDPGFSQLTRGFRS